MTGTAADARVPSLYPEVVLDHCRHPRHFGALPGARPIRAANPLCGDQIDVYLQIENDIVRDIAFDGVACAVARASASLMTEAMFGRDLAYGRRLVDAFRRMVDAGSSRAEDPDLGTLRIFAELREFPGRHPCVTLAWNALHEALQEAVPDTAPAEPAA